MHPPPITLDNLSFKSFKLGVLSSLWLVVEEELGAAVLSDSQKPLCCLWMERRFTHRGPQRSNSGVGSLLETLDTQGSVDLSDSKRSACNFTFSVIIVSHYIMLHCIRLYCQPHLLNRKKIQLRSPVYVIVG